VIARREAALWTAAFILVSALLVATRFQSDDPDSALYASISARLADEPVSRWLAPEWWGFWPEAEMTGLFREHPAGVFLLPAALDRLGIPAEQGAYIVGIGAGLASLVLAGSLVARLTSAAEARAALVLLQLMPVAFIFRIRANHEYPLLVCLLVTIVGLDRVRRSWVWAIAVAAGLTGALIVKGVFVVLVMAAAAIWIAVQPGRGRPFAALVAGLAVMAAAAMAYDAAYLSATGETFWAPYWERQLGPLEIATPLDGASTLALHAAFYASILLWHPAPWSLALFQAVRRRAADLKGWWRRTPDLERRGVIAVLLFAAFAIVALSPSSRFAERYAFLATFTVGAAGAVAAFRLWAWVPRLLDRLQRVLPALPVVLWFTLMVLRLALGPLLPRVS
jgi:4-amino-4-deoxy-L-arabinose transferase-like glycosyltransferase